MPTASRLCVISFAASGYDSLDVNAATKLGIVVTNAVAAEGSEVVADRAWGLMLAVQNAVDVLTGQECPSIVNSEVISRPS